MSLLLLSILPTVVILIYIYYKDKYEQEPLSLLLAAFGTGILATGCVFFTFALLKSTIPYTINTGNGVIDSFLKSFFEAAIPEELFKFLALYILIWKNPNFNERFDGIIYAVFVSLGLATFENILYVFSYGHEVGIARAILSVPAHALFGVAMGYYFSFAKFTPQSRKRYLTLSLVVPILLHGIYDFLPLLVGKLAQTHPLLPAVLMFAFLAFVIFLWVQGLKKIKRLSSDFYFTDTPNVKIKKEHVSPKNSVSKSAIFQTKFWYDTDPALFDSEREAILQKYPQATLEIINGIVKFSIEVNSFSTWKIQLSYAQNYRKLSQQLRLYIIFPPLNELMDRTNELPYMRQDLSGNYFLDLAPYQNPTGVETINNALTWIHLFEDWSNKKIKLSDFIIDKG